jgi:hypothetical protein
MSEPARPDAGELSAPPDAAESPGVKAAAAWVSRLARTLKTCRLYDVNNPTVVKFRDDLAAALTQQLAEHGRMVLSFTSDDVLADEVSLYPARSREDNLAMPFYRDGIRSIAFEPGITPKEIEAILDAVLRVTRHDVTDDDLVTLLWDSNLEHVSVDAASTEGDVETGASADEEEAGPVAPWPRGGPAPGTGSGPAGAGSGGAPEDRSDDRETGVEIADLPAVFRELSASAAAEVQRLVGECEREASVPVAEASLHLIRACLYSLNDPAARTEVGAFLPRVLHETLAQGQWSAARDALDALRQCEIPGWSVQGLVNDLLQPASLTTRGVIEHLDANDLFNVGAFVEFARDLGVESFEWLMRVLAESQEQRTRRPLLRLIADFARDNPERLSAWLADERWYVVRNVVHILGWIGGNQIAGLLGTAAEHDEIRVRREVIAAFAQVDPGVARPRLLALLDQGDPLLIVPVLHQLAGQRDWELTRRLLREVQAPGFDARPDEERQAILSTLGGAADDQALPILEAELLAGNWLNRRLDARRDALARCIAGIGTPAARDVLERGAKSRRAPVSRACLSALRGFQERT